MCQSISCLETNFYQILCTVYVVFLWRVFCEPIKIFLYATVTLKFRFSSSVQKVTLNSRLTDIFIYASFTFSSNAPILFLDRQKIHT